MAEVQENNAAVEIQRRKAIIEAREKLPAADAAHRANVPAKDIARSPTMHPERMRLAEFDRNEWIANAEPGHSVEDLLNPAYWSHMAQQMNPYDHIEVRAEDGSWIAELLVVQADRQWAKVILKAKYDLVAKDRMPSVVKQHEVQWKGPQHRFGVIRLSDSEMIRAGFKTKDEASAWMREHEQVISSPQ